ncbi:uncharacterized protein LACBIDRAFT_296375 [Laccaria bicolor S238N-H82]|uniref:Predicted protein n=1 Tax=Laccaria bicolor (strain S238N-H82 / ATCC MYA-4686) TaxID=486041 RepID=B0D8M9_LACBS|nr:uncharacterized protein LACBIDRAFT_296375 [Laccaria bicolor S238N-H82]EDR08872.1 predicted protein [Laccaria bicolor S238N-H82]|eukprot:XP_001880185.1 predicted protein [Laccaria bicolor S238N-H82]
MQALKPQPSSLLPLYLSLLRHRTCRQIPSWKSLARLSPRVLDSAVIKSTILFRATLPISPPSRHESQSQHYSYPTLSCHPHRA